jgi:hypothetical protein
MVLGLVVARGVRRYRLKKSRKPTLRSLSIARAMDTSEELAKGHKCDRSAFSVDGFPLLWWADPLIAGLARPKGSA